MKELTRSPELLAINCRGLSIMAATGQLCLAIEENRNDRTDADDEFSNNTKLLSTLARLLESVGVLATLHQILRRQWASWKVSYPF